MVRSNFVIAFVAAGALASIASASPVSLSFFRVDPHNSSQNPASQFSCVMDVVTPGPGGQVSFTFTNAVGIASSISEIYFQDGPLLGEASLNQVGTNFSAGPANPGNLPGGNNLTPPFIATELFSADAQGNPSNGIDTASDSLRMTFHLLNSKSFDDCVSALQTGDLRIGMHVRAIGTDGQSDSFVNNSITAVPLPMTSTMAMAGLSMVMLRRRRA
jgi:hypothetical protein